MTCPTLHSSPIMALHHSLPNPHKFSIEPILTETSHVLQRAGMAGFLGLGAAPLFFSKRTLPPWRIAILGSSALASCSVPFLVMERLAFHSLTNAVDKVPSPDWTQYALYMSHATGTVWGAAILHVLRRTKGRLHVPMQVLAPMLCKAQIEIVLME